MVYEDYVLFAGNAKKRLSITTRISFSYVWTIFKKILFVIICSYI